MTRLLNGKHFWIALVLATLLLIVMAPLRIRRSAPHRFASTPTASLRTV
jgi:bacteriorhodopsin